MADDSVRIQSRRGFVDELLAVTRERPAAQFLYLMLEEGGLVGVQWEQPGHDHYRRYRILEPDGPACPHCVIVNAVTELAPVLPLDVVRMDRIRRLYESVLRSGLLPNPAFARPPGDPVHSWLGDCHGAPGNPHTDADCDAHRATTAPVTDPLEAPITLPPALLALYPDAAAAAHDIETRLRIVRSWRDGAHDVAGERTETQPTWAFLRTGGMLGLPVAGAPDAVIALRPGAAAPDRSIADLLAAAPLQIMAAGGPPYQDGLCLVPDPGVERRLPIYVGAIDVLTGRPVRTIRLPVSKPALSRAGRGVLLLYQARYAMWSRHVPGPAKPLNYWESEASLQIFEFQLLRAIGGDTYTAAVQAFLDALAAAGDLLDRPQDVLDRRHRAALGRVFRDADDAELHLWGSVAYRNAIQLSLGSPQAFAEYLRAARSA